jgi:hypothetical protein
MAAARPSTETAMAFDTRLIVTISSPKAANMSREQRRFLAALADRIERRGLRVLSDGADTENAERALRRCRTCQGVIVLGFGQWRAERLYRKQRKEAILSSEFSHIKAIMATAHKLPLLVFRDKSLTDRGVFRGGYLPNVVKLPQSLRLDWFDQPEFELAFKQWIDEVNCFRHVFLGYSNQATETGASLQHFLSKELGLRVFDWHAFGAGDSVWESIERAEHLTRCGLFLFMADDRLATTGTRGYAPRDNVVYEAGYFAGAKGRSSSLIVREEGAKIPTDLGGILYLNLQNRGDISTIEAPLRNKLEDILTDQETRP